MGWWEDSAEYIKYRWSPDPPWISSSSPFSLSQLGLGEVLDGEVRHHAGGEDTQVGATGDLNVSPHFNSKLDIKSNFKTLKLIKLNI